MRRKGGIELFSTSSIDLLACGLGAVLVLWLLVFGNEGGALTGERNLGSGEMRIRQYGTSHLEGFELEGYELVQVVLTKRDGTKETYPASSFTSADPFPTQSAFNNTKWCHSGGNSRRFTATYEEPGGKSVIEVSCRASVEFAREVSISFEDMRAAHKVGVIIKTCAAEEIHYLEMQSIDRRGSNDARWVFHCKGFADGALGKSPSSAWERFFQARIKAEVEKMCPPDGWEKPFDYRVHKCAGNVPLTTGVRFTGDGAVRFVEPAPNPAAPELGTINGDDVRDRIVAWSGGTYGAGRLPAGLPVCTP